MGELKQFGRRWRVLVADQLEVNRLILQDLLEQEGCTVVVAANGDTALDALEETPFHLIILEYRLPGEDGGMVMQAYRQILAHSNRTSEPAPVILPTQETGADAAVEIGAGKAAGAFRVPRKPFRTEQVREAARAALGLTAAS